MRARGVGVAVVALLSAACSSDDESASSTLVTSPPDSAAPLSTETVPSTTESTATIPPTTAPVDTTAPVETTVASAPPTTVPSGPLAEIVTALAADELRGRDNLSRGSAAARQIIVSRLGAFAQPVPGLDGYDQEFASGTNVLAFVEGSDLADQYVIVGAHYDHLTNCREQTIDDPVCNGAADNAAGVAAVLEAARVVAEQAPRRSVLIALWDAEEDGLLGATHFVLNPVVPLDRTVAYVNLDLLGANLLPSLSRSSLLIGAETGGPALMGVVDAAARTVSLDLVPLSVAFGQGRSDHAPFAQAGVPVMFFSDATNGCYHSVLDDLEHLDVAKLALQADFATETLRILANADDAPAFDLSAPVAGYRDAVSLLGMLEAGQGDFELLGAAADVAAGFLVDLRDIVAAGPDEFGDDDVARLFDGSFVLINAFADQECRP